MGLINVEAKNVWEVFQRERESLLDSMKEIASAEAIGSAIYLTNEGGIPVIVVYVDDDEVRAEPCYGPADCEATVKDIYDTFLNESGVVNALLGDDDGNPDDDDGYFSTFEKDSQIEDREDELSLAVSDFIDIACPYGTLDILTNAEFDEMIEDVKDHFCEYLARKWNVPVKRPMYLEDDDGTDFFTLYPYESMVFDDEDNPIYQRESKTGS